MGETTKRERSTSNSTKQEPKLEIEQGLTLSNSHISTSYETDNEVPVSLESLSLEESSARREEGKDQLRARAHAPSQPTDRWKTHFSSDFRPKSKEPAHGHLVSRGGGRPELALEDLEQFGTKRLESLGRRRWVVRRGLRSGKHRTKSGGSDVSYVISAARIPNERGGSRDEVGSSRRGPERRKGNIKAHHYSRRKPTLNHFRRHMESSFTSSSSSLPILGPNPAS